MLPYTDGHIMSVVVIEGGQPNGMDLVMSGGAVNVPADIEADCRELVATVDRQAAASYLGLPTDPAEVDAVAKRLIERGFPVGDFVREVMVRRFGYDPETRSFRG